MAWALGRRTKLAEEPVEQPTQAPTSPTCNCASLADGVAPGQDFLCQHRLTLAQGTLCLGVAPTAGAVEKPWNLLV